MTIYRCGSIFNMTFLCRCQSCELEKTRFKKKYFFIRILKENLSLKHREKYQKAHCKNTLPHVETEIR